MADPTLVGDLVTRERRSDRLALHAAELDRTYSYFDLCNTACKAGNVLSHLGVREGDRVAVAPEPLPEPVLTFLGAALLGAVTEFDADIDPESDARAVVVPAERESEFDLPGGSKLCVFGGAPDRPDTTHWEQEVWSENPAFPPTFHDPEDAVLRDAETGTTYSHAGLLAAAGDVVGALDIDVHSRIAVRAPLSDPRTVAAGVLAPLVAGGAVAFPGGDASLDATAAVVADGHAAREARTLAVQDVDL